MKSARGGYEQAMIIRTRQGWKDGVFSPREAMSDDMSPLFGKKTRSKRRRENQRKDLVCIINILESTLHLSMLLSKELSDEIWLLLPFINLSVS